MYTIAEAKDAIKCGIRGYLLKDQNGSYIMKETNRLPFYLEGAPGIGKTEIVSQIAKELGIGYVSFSLVHHTRNSLLGLPVIKDLDNGGKYTSYTMSEIFAKVLEAVNAGQKEGILLLDEFPCMSETILPTMLSFLQTKNIGTYTLPEGWVIVLCGNPPAYNKTARTFDAAIMDRLRKLEVAFQPEVFLAYGKAAGLHEAILEYLESHIQNVYYYKQEKKNLELVTCRGWENLSHMLKAYEELEQGVDEKDVAQYIKAEAIALDFAQFYKEYNCGWNRKMIQEILEGKGVRKYSAKCKKMDFKAKRNLAEYALGIVKAEHKDVEFLDACLEEAKVMLKEIEDIRKEEEKSGCKFTLILPEIAEILDALRVELQVDSSEMREEVLERWGKWETASEECYDLFSMLEEYDEEEIAVFDVAYSRLKDWISIQEDFLREDILRASNKIEHFLTFARKVDDENALVEGCFLYVNQQSVLLKILSKCPSPSYLELCEMRYAKKAS